MACELIVTACYPGNADTVFAEALSFAGMAEATRGMAVYQDMPEGEFEEGKTYTLNVTVWGVMKNPEYQVHVERLDRDARTVQSREHGWMIRQWDHTLSIQPQGDGCLWTDRILIDCSWATPFMSRVARQMYRTRHRNRAAQGITALLRRI